MSAGDVRLSPGEALVWRGAPHRWRFAVGAFRLSAIGLYAAFVVGFQIWRSIDSGEGIADAAPSVVLIAAAFAVFVVVAWRMALGVSYTVTNRRLVLTYGLAMRATLSLPFSRIRRISLALGPDGTGDILIDLKPGERVPYAKLWPLGCGFWRKDGARPLLRATPNAALIGGLLARAAHAAAQDDQKSTRTEGFIAPTASETQRRTG